MKKRVYSASLLVAVLTPALGLAEQPVATMEEVVVTATRQEEKVSSVPAHITVITKEEIEQSTARNVPDLLRSEAGIQVVDVTGNKRNFKVDLRGFGETAQSNTLVLVDGRRINQPDLSGADWTLIDLNRIARIEVIRGGRGSVLYGDNASGGVVNIITKEGEEGIGAGAEVSGGSYETFKSSAYVNGMQNNVSYDVSASYYTSEGYRLNSESEAKDAGLNLSYYLGELAKLNFSSDYHKDNTGLPGRLKESDFASGVSRKDSLFQEDFAETEDYYFKGGPEIYFLTDSMIKLDVSYRNRKAFSFASFFGGSFEGDTEIDTVAFSPQIVLREKIMGHENNLIVGFDYTEAEEDILNKSVFFGFASEGSFTLEKENYGYYIHDELQVLNGLSLSGGYRYDRVTYSFSPSTPDHTTMDEESVTVGANYAYHDKSHVYASFSRSFRYPVLDELFSFFRNTINSNLVSQKSDDYEIGIKHYFSDGLYANVNLFRINTDDEIFFNANSFANENLDGKTRRDGVEISAAKSFKRVTINGSYTFTDAEIRGGQFEGNDIPSVSEHKFTLGCNVSLGKGFSLNINGYYIGERPFESDFAGAVDDQDDYFVLNAKLSYEMDHFQAFVGVNNITDDEYSEFGAVDFLGEKGFFPSPETNVLAGVSIAY